ncbi:HEPN domain-containing protein [Rubrobacter marinus]|uniref:HEPN domain-containing protein n=1 Tax=Rubrobacter marinus TaxID=2653852 RepID=A0A6G8PUA8_9ACTN|nr:HEPN domain-containing protein [Rubrobacter marinus]QIN77944.1 HEPN domain-containing protein [Rubrobacter marinus]
MSQVRALLHKAERSFSAAVLLLEAGSPDFAASRAYYGCFYVAEALLLSEGLRFSRHGQVISQYGRLFAKEERLDRRFHRLLDYAFSIRQAADYTVELAIDAGETRKVIEEGKTFLAAAQEYLDRHSV